MLPNKWIVFVMSAAVTFLGVAAAFDWKSILSPEAAGVVVAVIGASKMVLNVLMPTVGQRITPTNESVVTHKVD